MIERVREDPSNEWVALTLQSVRKILRIAYIEQEKVRQAKETEIKRLFEDNLMLKEQNQSVKIELDIVRRGLSQRIEEETVEIKIELKGEQERDKKLERVNSSLRSTVQEMEKEIKTITEARPSNDTRMSGLLTDLTNCSICYESYSDTRIPGIAFCGHTYCSSCIPEFEDYKCPLCQKCHFDRPVRNYLAEDLSSEILKLEERLKEVIVKRSPVAVNHRASQLLVQNSP